MARQKTAGVVGNGSTGSAIAGRLLDCGHTVYVRDAAGRTAAPAGRGAR